MRTLPRIATALLAGLALLTTGVNRPVRAAQPPRIRESSYAVTIFGRVAIYQPASAPRATALLLSGDGGWNPGAARVAQDLAAHGMLVAGISTPTFMRSLEHARGSCINPNYALIGLARNVQHHMGVHAYMKPIIIGYSAGATIAYAGLAQWPNGGYRGVFSLGFSNDMPGRKPWCRAPGFSARPMKQPVRGWLFAPSTRIKVPWIVLQGGEDKVVDFAAARRFVAAVPRARMIALPNVAHDFADHRQWMPQMAAAFSPMLAHIGPRADGLPQDLPITIVPATGRKAPGDIMAVIYSGDGGWVGIDRDIAAQLSARGIPVVGVDSLSYFWSARTPQGAAQDLRRIIAAYGTRWHRPKVMLIGYSFGADVLPAIVGSLDSASRARVDSLSLLGLGPSADFQFHLASWLNISSARALPTIPAILQLKGMDIRCIRGALEAGSACGDIPTGIAKTTTVPGDHHFNRNAQLLAYLITA
ncbi:AcvB/VirJ family lysyl-phosphatidylglycerol hydrolase [Sphingobium nicotianae]|uniref:Virulence factor family protein n=1 Tax=Sphingobium nicotianae TaxID=2782607 RepID=A0A9X1DFQ2_9SPHN|nr:AcvB/VirJ family lysyl-phosphatidylglycerol hydrolase [Sphingobium nicotianae]MBT2189140.1 virulence factor family protein [Sphingobium nicotianae]